ncbi:succinyl-diaminopimelate desuccinylase [Pseudoalteromonas sp. SSDWG2]|uniref:succinyl-diaminopimelate desuccinylase n=1 Tax=Pseudoalteromonas sp. SSDWG2 TaxID=3139391 RepID=UPI003BAA6C62
MSLTACAQQQYNHDAVHYLQRLIRFKSVTPDHGGAITWLVEQLTQRGFTTEVICSHGVTNLVAYIDFGVGPTFAFSGHVDVVPAIEHRWCCAPFAGDIINGEIIGRGAADMKGGIAAMLAATDRLLCDEPNQGRFYWLITSDEEGEAEYGSALIAKYLQEQGVRVNACLVGEPTSQHKVGDTIKNGRRGALSARVRVSGRSGHVAYPENSINAAHIGANIALVLQAIKWPEDILGSKTCLQVTAIDVPNSLDNLVPARCHLAFNVRYSHAYHSDDIINTVEGALSSWREYIDISWERPCEPYYTSPTSGFDAIALLEQAIYEVTQSYPSLSTSGGTSDGRFFANEYTQVVECGVRNHTIHQDNERVAIADLTVITDIYEYMLKSVFNRDEASQC